MVTVTSEQFKKDLVCKGCGASFVRRWANNVFCTKKCLQRFQWKKHRSGTAKERERVRNRYQRLRFKTSYRFSFYKMFAKRRGLGFFLTREEFFSIYKQPCFYCGRVFEVMGLDRVDSTKHYTLDNVVSACWRCNVAKSNLTHQEFIEMCNLISKKHHA